MSDAELQALELEIESRLRSAEPDVELLALERPSSEQLRLFIDRPGGVDLALCERVTDLLRDLLADYGLEVSSPGPERPLSKPRHYRRHLGERVRVRTKEPIGGRRSFTGRLAEAGEDSVSVEAGEEVVTIPLTAVHRSNLVPDENANFEVSA